MVLANENVTTVSIDLSDYSNVSELRKFDVERGLVDDQHFLTLPSISVGLYFNHPPPVQRLSAMAVL